MCVSVVFSLQLVAQSKDIDSINLLLDKASNSKEYTYNDRLSFITQSERLAHELQIDSLTLKSQIQLAALYREQKLYDLFLKTNSSNIQEGKRIGATKLLANVYSIRGYYFYYRISDSAFYFFDKSEKLYNNLNDNYNRASMLLNIAIIQKNEKDFIGSEVTSFKGIKILDSFPSEYKINRKKAFFYNNLGVLYDQLEQYDDAINYHKKALSLKRSLGGDNLATINNSLNNIAVAYKNSGNYIIALTYFEDLLKNPKLKEERPGVYALILDNYAQTCYLNGNEKELPQLFLKALHICDSIGASYNSIIINRHLAEFYFDKKQLDSAKYYAYTARDLSKQYHKDDLLKSLLLLTKIESDSIAIKYYKDYIKLNDSLQKEERSIRNKFARIRYETNEIEQKNKKITRERLLLMLFSLALLVSSIFIFIIISQRNKNKTLEFKQSQQQSNEDIYNLMLSQQDRIEEARVLEKRRISEELHDGILSRLFGTRLSLDSLNTSKTDDAIQTRSNYINELKAIEQEIRKVSHELNIDFVANSSYIGLVKTLLEKQSSAYNLVCHLKYEDEINWEEVSNKIKIYYYRIIQEALQNSWKHAEADHVNIEFYTTEKNICLDILDDGKGFNLSKSKKGIGLKNMTSRVNEIGGFLIIKSNKNIGTKIIIHTPILNT